MGTRRIKQRKKAYTIGPNGERSIPLSPEAAEIFKEQERKFREKFGRDPGPRDPIFFDEDADTAQPYSEAKIEEMNKALAQVMGEAGTAPELIYAYNKTGRMVTEQNMKFLTDDEIEEWNAAIAEYREKEGGPKQ